MKILYCIPSLSNPGGMERVLTEKANYLSLLPNYEITIITTDQLSKNICFPLNDKIRLIHLDINFNVHYSTNLLIKLIYHYRKLAIYKKKIVQLINQFDIEICISLCGKEIEFLSKLDIKCKRIAEIHFAMNFRSQFITSRHNGFIWKLLGSIRTYQLKKSVKGLDKMIVLTKADEDQWKITHKNIVQIPNPNPLNNDTYANLDKKEVITIGKLDAQKGYDMLIDIWALVVLKHPDWKLNIWGDGEWKQMLSNKINILNLTNNINLCGQTNNVISKYLDSSIYVMTSRYEGLPMVLIEAMSCGLPIVSFDCECGPRDIVSDGINGFLVEPNNINQFAEKICCLIENESLRKQMGVQAIKNIDQFSKEKIMREWINLFENL